MKRRTFLGTTMLLVAAAPVSAAPSLPPMEIFKSPHCGCCGAWVDHMRAAGFTVKVTDVDDTTAARKRLRMPDAYGGCHTATVGGYVIEGHVFRHLSQDLRSAT
jgi:hypothetical protein